jgi:hypothetical protein
MAGAGERGRRGPGRGRIGDRRRRRRRAGGVRTAISVAVVVFALVSAILQQGGKGQQAMSMNS